MVYHVVGVKDLRLLLIGVIAACKFVSVDEATARTTSRDKTTVRCGVKCSLILFLHMR